MIITDEARELMDSAVRLAIEAGDGAHANTIGSHCGRIDIEAGLANLGIIEPSEFLSLLLLRVGLILRHASALADDVATSMHNSSSGVDDLPSLRMLQFVHDCSKQFSGRATEAADLPGGAIDAGRRLVEALCPEMLLAEEDVA